MTLFLVLCCDRCHAAGGWQTGRALQHRGRHGADRCKDLWGHHDHAGQQHTSFIQGTSALSLSLTHTHQCRDTFTYTQISSSSGFVFKCATHGIHCSSAGGYQTTLHCCGHCIGGELPVFIVRPYALNRHVRTVTVRYEYMYRATPNIYIYIYIYIYILNNAWQQCRRHLSMTYCHMSCLDVFCIVAKG